MADTTPTDPTDQPADELTVDLAFRMGLALGRIEAKVDALLTRIEKAVGAPAPARRECRDTECGHVDPNVVHVDH